MKDTSCGKDCVFVKCGICENEKGCPNYQESWWIEGQKEQPVLLKDCAPKRMLIQQQLMQSRLEGMQSALEESRNEYNNLSGYLKEVLLSCKRIVDQEYVLLEKKDENTAIDYDPNLYC